MEPFQFACPYCSGQFEIDQLPEGNAVACPHCGEAVGFPAELASPQTESARSGAAELPDGVFDFLDRANPATKADSSNTAGRRGRPRTLTRQERERLRMRRNVVLMVVGVVVLSLAAVLLSRV